MLSLIASCYTPFRPRIHYPVPSILTFDTHTRFLRATILAIIRLGLLAPYWLTRAGTGRHYGYKFGFVFPFGQIEVNVAMWTASVPAYKALLNRILPRLWPTDTSHSSSDRGVFDLEPAVLPATTERPYRAPSAVEPLPNVRRHPHAGTRGLTQSEANISRFEHDTEITSLGGAGRCTPGSDIRSSSQDRDERMSTHTV